MRHSLGYAGVQLGTRFIATHECKASDAYKQAIVGAGEDDIVLTERFSGVPVAVIGNAVRRADRHEGGRIARWMFEGRTTKHWMRTFYALNSTPRLKKSLMTEDTSGEYWKAGKSVAGIDEVKPAAQIVREFAATLD